jgi:hypothetical protein
MLKIILALNILNLIFIIFIINELKACWKTLNANSKEILRSNENAIGCFQAFTEGQNHEMIKAVKKEIKRQKGSNSGV